MIAVIWLSLSRTLKFQP
ncbi:DUF645 family protein [Vibrio cholerae]|nr:DUF645 family protein [Vibrio cholerae]